MFYFPFVIPYSWLCVSLPSLSLSCVSIVVYTYFVLPVFVMASIGFVYDYTSFLRDSLGAFDVSGMLVIFSMHSA